MELHWEDNQSLLTQIQDKDALIQRQKKEIDFWKRRARCTQKEINSIKKHGKTRVVGLLGDTHTESYKTGYRVTFSSMWTGYRAFFGIGSINDTMESDYTKAIHWINDWKPREALVGSSQQLTLGGV